MLGTLQSLSALFVILMAAFGLGRPCIRRLGVAAAADPLSVGVWSLTSGLVLAGTCLLVLARLNWLHPLVFAGLTLASCVWAIVELACDCLARRMPRPLSLETTNELDQPPLRISWSESLVGALAVLVLLASLAAALTLPTSPETLARTLEAPKRLLSENQTTSALWPGPRPTVNLVQIWYAWALMLEGPTTASLLNWALGLLAATAVLVLAREIAGPRFGVLAAGLALLCPGFQYQMAACVQEDLALALLAVLAVHAGWQVCRGESGAWGILCGAMAGAAVAARPAGLALVGALAIAWIWTGHAQRDLRRTLLRAAGMAAAACLVIAVPWAAIGGVLIEVSPHQHAHSVLTHLGPVLLIVPAGMLFARRLSGLHWSVLVLTAYVSLCCLAPLPGRWWAPVAPLGSLAAAWVWRELSRLPPWRRATVFAALGLVLCRAAWPVFDEGLTALPVACGFRGRDAFLSAREPTYRAAALLNCIRRSGDRVLCDADNSFYFACPAVCTAGDQQPPATDNPTRWIGWARAAGYSYVLVADRAGKSQSAPASPLLDVPDAVSYRFAIEEQTSVGEIIPILDYRFADDNNRRIRYRLLRLR